MRGGIIDYIGGVFYIVDVFIGDACAYVLIVDLLFGIFVYVRGGYATILSELLLDVIIFEVSL